MMRPCLRCGAPSEGARCPEHTQPRRHALSATRRGYDTAWAKLSKRARRLQPFCTDCGTTTDLTADHTEEAWARRERGLPIRLTDVTVVCRSCNSRRGAVRHAAQVLDTRGGKASPQVTGPPGKAKFVSGIGSHHGGAE